MLYWETGDENCGASMTTPLDVVVVGNVGVDTCVYFYSDPNLNVESNYTLNLDYVGQSGGYTTRGFAQLGYKTAFIGYVGDDFCGKLIRADLERDDIDLSAVDIDPAGSGRSINLVYRDGRRINFYDGKSHMTLQPDLEKCRQVMARARIALFSIPNWARWLLPMARDLGMTIACDLQDVVDVHDSYRRDFIAAADVLFFSSVNFPSPQPVMERILAEFPQKLIIAGMGAKGCALASAAGIIFYPAVELPEPVVDATGAGDALAVGFLTSYFLENLSVEESILRAQIAARWTCTQKADTSHLIRRPQLDELYQRIKSL
jgi:acarbose 7IV-phosphotransferase